MSDLALFFHILGVLLFVSGIVVAGVAFESARRRAQPAEISLLLGLSRIGVVLVAVGGVILLGFGLWLVDLEGFDFGEGWVSAALALFVVSLVLGAAAGQRPKQARRLATKLTEEGRPVSPELRVLLDDPRSLAANYLSAAIVIAILVLMVFKP